MDEQQIVEWLVRVGVAFLERTSPAFIPLIGFSVPIAKKGTDLILWALKRFRDFAPSGIAIQAITAALAVGAVGYEAFLVGMFRDGTDLRELALLLVVVLPVWAGAVWWHEVPKEGAKRIEQAKADRATESGA